MKKILAILSLFIAVNTVAQNKELDSIKLLIESYKQLDTVFVKLSNEYGKAKLIVAPKDSTVLKYHLKALEVSEKLGYIRGKIESNKRIAAVYQFVFSNPEKALEYCHKVIQIAGENEKFRDEALSVYTNIGVIYSNMKEYEKAIIYHKKSLRYKPKSIATLSNLATAYGSLMKIDSSIYYYQRAIDVGRKSESKLYLANILSNLSLVLNRVNRMDESLKYIEESIDLVNQHKLQIIRAHVYKTAATIYSRKANYKKAEEYALEALKATESINYNIIKNSVWKMLFNIYKIKGDHENALEFYMKYDTVRDSINSNDKKLEIERKQIMFEADMEKIKAENEVVYQKKVTKVLIFASIVVILALIFGFITNKRKQKAQYEAKVANTELKALRAQMNPHFIFNSLNSINSFISKNNTQEANNYLTKFAKLMRQTLENSEHAMVPLEDELAAISNYMDIERKRLEDKFDYQIMIDQNINAEEVLIPPAILQPFIENSIWHGISNMKEQGEVVIAIKKENGMLVCVIEDNGVGMSNTKKVRPHKSRGIQITRDRIEFINSKKTRGERASVMYKDREIGTSVIVKLPFEAYN
jgi:tetratricopeptide (TPR) repeat protein